MFLGDSGSYSLSFIIALLTLYVYDIAFAALPADLIALWFLIPVVDCLRVMSARAARGHSPFASDRGHLHHILYRRLPWRWGLAVYFGLAGVPGLLASFAPHTTLAWGLASLCCYGVIIAWPQSRTRTAGDAAK
jgi:UDP-GlcNAc:undecaprenyl-phosphate GlcNAc-1-phosphate transferase